MAAPETPNADNTLSDTAMAEFKQLVTDHPEAVTLKLNYNGNGSVVVSVPHIVAAIARTTSRPYTEVACRRESKQLWSFISATMKLQHPKENKGAFWPEGVPVFDKDDEEIRLPSPAAVVKLGPTQPRYSHTVNLKVEATLQVWLETQILQLYLIALLIRKVRCAGLGEWRGRQHGRHREEHHRQGQAGSA